MLRHHKAHLLIACWVIFHAFLLSAEVLIFFKINVLRKFFKGIPSERQTVWTLIRPDDSSDLIWVQTACQGYQQMTLEDKGLIYCYNECFILLDRNSLLQEYEPGHEKTSVPDQHVQPQKLVLGLKFQILTHKAPKKSR